MFKKLFLITIAGISILFTAACSDAPKKEHILKMTSLDDASAFYADYLKGQRGMTPEEEKAMQEKLKEKGYEINSVNKPFIFSIEGRVFLFYSDIEGKIVTKEIEE